MTTDRIHTPALSQAAEHLAAASNQVRGAILADTATQEQAAAQALAELDHARTILQEVTS